jgi:ATP-binding cassette subfamily C protein LapB
MFFVKKHGLRAPALPLSVIVASVFVNVLALALPLSILQVYDRVLPNEATSTLAVLIIGLIGIQFIDVAMKLLRGYVMGISAAKFSHNTSLEAFSRIIYTPPSIINDHMPASYVNSMDAISELGKFYGSQARLSIIDFPAALIFLLIMWLVGGSMVLVPIIISILLAPVAYRRNSQLSKLAAETSVVSDRKHNFIMDALSGIHIIKSMAMEAMILRRYERLQRQYGKLNHDTIAINGESQASGNIYTSLSVVTLVSYGGILAIKGQASVGALACCIMLSGLVVRSVLQAINVWSQLQIVNKQKKQVEKIFRLPDARPDSCVELEGKSSISIRNLTYCYDGSKDPVIRDLSLEIAAGEMVGFTGSEGSGRSTLMRLIHGNLRPTAGEILIEKMPILGPHGERNHKGVIYVDQKPTIFRGSVLDNLTMFKKDEYIDKAIVAAVLTGMDQHVQKHPDGYDMDLGEKVYNDIPSALTQRLSLARALVRDPAILILDEVSNRLGQWCDASFLDTLESLHGLVTVLIVSDRPMLLGACDRVFEIRDAGAFLVEKSHNSGSNFESEGVA